MKIKLPRYTQGDWYPSDDNGCKDICVRNTGRWEEDDDAEIATLHTEGRSIGYTHGLNCEVEDQANADIICASPRMIEFIAKKAESGDKESIAFLETHFKVKSCDTCRDRFECFTEKKFRHS